MLSIGKKILLGLLIVDVGIAILLSTFSLSILAGWIFLNAIVIIPAVLVWKALTKRRRGGQGLFRAKEYGIACTTLNGEMVKSKGEKRIADYFYQNNIRYEYETSAWTNGQHRNRIISKPDFYLPEYDVFVEYWGMVNVKENRKREEYVRNMKRKMAQYRDNNIKLISLYPDNIHNLDWIFKVKLREATGIDLNKR